MIKTEDQLKALLLAKGIRIKDFTYQENEEKNIYGVKDVPPLQNPYLWNVLTKQHNINALAFLLEYKPEWINIGITLAILQGIDRDNKRGIVTEAMISTILHCLIKNQPDMIRANFDQILMSTIQDRLTKITKIVFDFIIDEGIELNPEGAFMYGGLSEAAKSADMNLIKMIEKQYPQSIMKCGDWPYLNAMKYGLYTVALYFAKRGNDIHAKNDLGYKLMERNDKKGLLPMGENKEAHDFLMDVYRGNKFL